MTKIYVFLIAFAVAFVMTPINIYFSRRFGFVDIPKDNRRMHKKAVATVGGISIFIGFLISALLFTDIDKKFLGFLVGATIIFITGIVDDKKALNAKIKLLIQIIAAIIAVLSGYRITFISNPFVNDSLFNIGFLGYIISIIWIIGVTNSLNLIDGIDGLCAGIATISGIALFVASEKVVPLYLSLAIAGSAAGFLPYNFHPAKIFMGDTGALFLGYSLAVFSIDGAVKNIAWMTFIVPVIILGVPVFDTLFAIIRRKINGKRMMDADKGHLQHKLVERGFSVPKTVLILYSVAIIFSALAIMIARLGGSIGMVVSLITVLMAVIFAYFLGMLSKEKSNEKD